MTKEELLKIFSAYLPYGLKICTSYNNGKSWNKPKKMLGADLDRLRTLVKYIPILYDLSYLTKEIEHEGEKVIPIDYISTSIKDSQTTMRRVENNQSLDVLDYWKIQRLLELHFNVFQLPEGEYINKATLTNK
ncbi:hypothetical protein [Chryseobacterium sp. MYb328]|uniref:hypothetical protein n=1 Tax=Chryseobacterium sp. MYb328 TaxID=2745231 RepID=UPI0030B0B1D9